MPQPFAVQSVLFRTSHFASRAAAEAKARKLGFRTHIAYDPNRGGAHTAYYRMRQRQPEEFQQKTFRTRRISPGIDLVVGRLKG